MIWPQEKDIGRQVVHTNKDGRKETGRITSFDTYFVFVQFEGYNHPQAFHRPELEWA